MPCGKKHQKQKSGLLSNKGAASSKQTPVSELTTKRFRKAQESLEVSGVKKKFKPSGRKKKQENWERTWEEAIDMLRQNGVYRD